MCVAAAYHGSCGQDHLWVSCGRWPWGISASIQEFHGFPEVDVLLRESHTGIPDVFDFSTCGRSQGACPKLTWQKSHKRADQMRMPMIRTLFKEWLRREDGLDGLDEQNSVVLSNPQPLKNGWDYCTIPPVDMSNHSPTVGYKYHAIVLISWTLIPVQCTFGSVVIVW